MRRFELVAFTSLCIYGAIKNQCREAFFSPTQVIAMDKYKECSQLHTPALQAAITVCIWFPDSL